MALRKIYLVPAEDYVRDRPQSLPAKHRQNVKTRHVAKGVKIGKQHSHDKWVALRPILREAAITESDIIHKFADFLCKLLLVATPQRHSTPEQRPKLEVINIAETPRPEPPIVGAVSSG